MSTNNLSSVERLLSDFAADDKAGTRAKPSDFEAPKEYRQDAAQLDRQKFQHRNILLYLVVGLSVASFALLAYVVIFQMLVRTHETTYTGVSDSVMKILAVSVFGQVITVVGTIALQVWKK